MYQEFTEEKFDITGYDVELVAHNAIFLINDFMGYLEKLYTTTSFMRRWKVYG